MKRIYMSFGGGVQSTTIALLAFHRDDRLLRVTKGAIPEMYLFADTGDERQDTYAHLWKMAQIITESGCLFLVVAREEALSSYLTRKALAGESGMNTLPLFIASKNTGLPVPVRRGCTQHYKIELLDRTAKRYFRVRRGKLENPVAQWLGISADEPGRMRTTDDQWRTYQYPLIEMGWTRTHCLHYLDTMGISAPRSSCVFCPFHGSEEWREVKKNPMDWAKVRDLDRALEDGFDRHGKVGGLDTRPYLSRHLKAIDQVDFGENQMSLFDWECSGVCGV